MNDIMRQYPKNLNEYDQMALLRVKELGLDFWQYVEDTLPPSREASIAKTKIEEAVMWAVKGITA